MPFLKMVASRIVSTHFRTMIPTPLLKSGTASSFGTRLLPCPVLVRWLVGFFRMWRIPTRRILQEVTLQRLGCDLG